jgi:hypothetical protein
MDPGLHLPGILSRVFYEAQLVEKYASGIYFYRVTLCADPDEGKGRLDRVCSLFRDPLDSEAKKDRMDIAIDHNGSGRSL